MTTATTNYTELSRSDLVERGIPIPREHMSAYLNPDGAITIMVYDPDGASLMDPPNEDHSGEDAWDWIAFDNGYERDTWIEANYEIDEAEGRPIFPDTDVWIERYEHSLVRYAPLGESSQVDRQWDVAQGVAVIRFTKPDEFWPSRTDRREVLLDIARGICEEYTAWCNGECFGMLRYEEQPVVHPLTPAAFAKTHWVQTDTCWGFIGYDYAEQTAQQGDW